MNFVVEHSGRFVSYCFDTIDAVAADSMTAISSLEFHVSVLWNMETCSEISLKLLKGESIQSRINFVPVQISPVEMAVIRSFALLMVRKLVSTEI